MNQTCRSLNAIMAQSKNCPFGVNIKIELKNIETIPHKNGIWQGTFQQRSLPVLSEVSVTFFSSIIVLAPYGTFWIVPLLHSVSGMTFAAVHEEQFYVDPSVYGLYLLPLPVGYLIVWYWAESATHLHTTCRTITASGVSLRYVH
jgi:hypothetical protein